MQKVYTKANSGEGEMVVSYQGVTVVLVPSERMTKGVLTYDVVNADERACIYTFLYKGSKGGFSGNRVARLRGEDEIGWLSRGNHLHPQGSPEAAALHYLKWAFRRSKRGQKVRSFRGAA